MVHCTTPPGIYWTAASASSLQTCKQGQLQKPLLLLKPIHQPAHPLPNPLAPGIWPEPALWVICLLPTHQKLVKLANSFIPYGMLKMLVTQDCFTSVWN